MIHFQAVGRGQILHFEGVAFEIELRMPARQFRIAEAELALDRTTKSHRAGDVVLVALIFALNHLQQPTRRCAAPGACFGRVDDLQFQCAQTHAVAGADLITLANLLFVDVSAAWRAKVGQVIEAVLLI